jgi:hypothetical protein
MKMALVLTAVLLLSGVSVAQRDWGWQYRDRNRQGDYDPNHSVAYNIGHRDGRIDRAHNRPQHFRQNSEAYRSGYRAGYAVQPATGVWPGRDDRRNDHDADDRRRNDHDGDDRWRNDHDGDDRGHGPYRGQNVQQVGYNNGFQEGLHAGEGDRVRRARYRCTTSDVYKHATAGYISSYGDKNLYRQNFQQGYRAGYDRSYYGR